MEKKQIETEEQKALTQDWYNPNCPELVAIKNQGHQLSIEYSQLNENDLQRDVILSKLLGQWTNGKIQGPIFFHYGSHTTIGKNFFANYYLVIQDDGLVTIGDDVMFGPNTTIVTPNHPLLAKERCQLTNEKGERLGLCLAKPVIIHDRVWLGASVTVCPGVTIGENTVIGAGSVVVKDIPANVVAAGNPCRVIRPITEDDRVFN